MVSLNDLASRLPRALADGEVLNLGGKRVRYIGTPHVAHAWEAGVMSRKRRRRCCAATASPIWATAPSSPARISLALPTPPRTCFSPAR